MKFFIILLGLVIGTGYGLFTRPNYFIIGQLDWKNVLTKGYFVGKFEGLLTRSMIDESFYHVLKFQSIGLAVAIGVIILISFFTKSKPAKKSKK